MEKKKRLYLLLVAIIVIEAVVIAIGISVLHVGVTAVCLLLFLQVCLAVLLHHAEIWMHGLVLLVELCAGAATGKAVLTILYIVIYVSVMAVMMAMDKGAADNGK